MGKKRTSTLQKRIDRFAGIPLLFLLGLFRKKRPHPSSVHRVGFLRTAAIGDTVLMAACTNAVKKQYPDAELIVFAGGNAPVAELLPEVDRVVKINATNPLRAIKTVCREGMFDLFFDFGQWPRIDGVIAAFAHSRFLAGFKTPGQWKHFACDATAEHRSDRHESQNFAALLKAGGITVDGKPELHVAPLKPDSKRVLVHMFSGGSRAEAKQWLPDRWREVILWLVQQGYSVELTGAGDEVPLVEEFAQDCPQGVRSIAGTLPLKDFAAYIAGSRLVVSVDTGTAHLASALNVPLVGLYGPTAPLRWGPLSDVAQAVVTDHPCRGCISLGFEHRCDDAECMSGLSVTQVIAALQKQLGE